MKTRSCKEKKQIKSNCGRTREEFIKAINEDGSNVKICRYSSDANIWDEFCLGDNKKGGIVKAINDGWNDYAKYFYISNGIKKSTTSNTKYKYLVRALRDCPAIYNANGNFDDTVRYVKDMIFDAANAIEELQSKADTEI